MSDHTVIAIDLAKSTFHVCVLNRHHNVTTERVFTRKRLIAWLVKQSSSTVAMECCGSAHHWARFAQRHGHEVMMIPPQFVTPFRKGHKTDANDALAIAITAKQPKMTTTAIKSTEQQGLQCIERIRQHHTESKTALSNMLRGLVFEFGITIPKGNAALNREIPNILEDAENELPIAFREQLAQLYRFYLNIDNELKQVEKKLFDLINAQSDCQALLALEGIGPVNALGLSLVLGKNGASFKNAREAAACIGMTPKQYSTGGIITLGGIGKRMGNKRLRASLVQGAMSVIRQLQQREPTTTKEQWIKQLLERSSMKKTAVALANKNIRTAWAILHYGKEYQKPKALIV